jgi:hypothetical protein
MINITRPWWPAGRPVVVADPFSGTGTVWLECHKLENVKLCCTDLAPVAPLLARDNRTFFGLSSRALDQLMLELRGLKQDQPPLAAPKSRRSATSEKVIESYQRAVTVFDKIAMSEHVEDIEIPQAMVEELEACSFLERLLFYVCLRTHVRHSGGFERQSEQWGMAFFKELDLLISQIDELINLRRSEEDSSDRSKGWASEFIGTYSLGAGVLPSAMEGREDLVPVGVHDARETFESSELVDVIITDPPVRV